MQERVVPADRIDAYRAAWRQIVLYATEASAHAWVFRSATRDGLFMEFVEWPGNEPALPSHMKDVVTRLDLIAPVLGTGTWKEWKT